jgi:hypothetical protein
MHLVLVIQVLLVELGLAFAWLPLSFQQADSIRFYSRRSNALARYRAISLDIANHRKKADSFEVEYKTIPLESLLSGVSPALVNISLPKLHNTYIGLRHGQSEANMISIISSDLEYGSKKHGLTLQGIEQAKSSADEVVSSIGKATELKDLIIYSSPFLRAYQTAQFCNEYLSRQYPNKDSSKLIIHVHKDLRERYFGEYDGKHLLYYNRVWPIDSV